MQKPARLEGRGVPMALRLGALLLVAGERGGAPRRAVLCRQPMRGRAGLRREAGNCSGANLARAALGLAAAATPAAALLPAPLHWAWERVWREF